MFIYSEKPRPQNFMGREGLISPTPLSTALPVSDTQTQVLISMFSISDNNIDFFQ